MIENYGKEPIVDLKQRYEVIRDSINEGTDVNVICKRFLEEIRHKAEELISINSQVTLVGATPLAWNIFNRREELFPRKEVLLADKKADISSAGGGIYLMLAT